jgi:hypothetical protein
MIGIRNVSGVSCHISCALQLLAHGLAPLTSLLGELIPILNNNDVLIEQLGRVLGELTARRPLGENNPVVDPTQLYKVLEKQTSLDPHDVGDVSTAVYQIFNVLRKVSPQWKDVVDYLVGMGQTQQLICGIQGNRLRIKRGKVKSMACPFPLPWLDRNHHAVIPSMGELLGDLVDPSPSIGAPIHDYDWENQRIESYTEEILDENGDGVTWKTTRCVQILQVPRFFFCSLDRFACTPDGERVLKLPEIHVPTTINIKNEEYRLTGGVLHVSEESFAEEGHYVTLISVGGDLTESWIFIDDEICRSLDNKTALSYLQGAETEDGTHYCAVLVLYDRHESDPNGWAEVASTLRENYERIYADWSKPESLVGRKLKVRWAKDRFYSGIVDYYDVETGKHRVLYDDGDVREYDLRNMTVEWECQQ